jgi:hypothetical protein
MVGEAVDLTYKYEHVGSDPAALAGLLAPGSAVLERLKGAKAPAVVVGPGVLRRADRDALMRSVHQLVEKAGEWRMSCVAICIKHGANMAQTVVSCLR